MGAFFRSPVNGSGMSVDELQEYGLAAMDDDEISNFLDARNFGVLGLHDDDAPYLLPLSYGYDESERLYFTYLEGSTSRKATLTEAAGAASFLVFAVDTPYSWESVLLSGPLSVVPESERDGIEDHLADAWRPAVLENADVSGDVRVFELRIEEQSGIKHQGLPPALEPAEE